MDRRRSLREQIDREAVELVRDVHRLEMIAERASQELQQTVDFDHQYGKRPWHFIAAAGVAGALLSAMTK